MKKLSKMLSLLLAVVMVITMTGMPAFAQDGGEPAGSSLSETLECTCSAAEGQDHAEDCPLYEEPGEPAGQEDDTPLSEPGCSLLEGCDPANNIHAEGCDLYEAPAEEPTGQENNSGEAEQECANLDGCDSENNVHVEGCPLYTAPAEDTTLSEAVQAVADLIAALPSFEDMESMNDDDLQTAMEQYAAARAAYEALTEEQQSQVSGAEVLAQFMEMISAVTPLADMPTTYQVNTAGKLKNAITNAVPGDTIELTEDITLTADDVSVEVSGKNTAGSFPITIDFKGHTIRGDRSTTGGIFRVKSSYVVLADSSEGTKGGVINTDTTSARQAIYVTGSPTGTVLEIKDGVQAEAQGPALYVDYGTVTIQDAKLTTRDNKNVINGRSSASVTINGGEFRCGSPKAFYGLFSGCKYTIYGGTFHQWTANLNGKVTTGKATCVSNTGSGSDLSRFQVTIQDEAPNEYVAWATDKAGNQIYLTQGDLYNLTWALNSRMDTIHVTQNASFTYPEGEAYGSNSSNKEFYLDLAAGVTLSGNVPMKYATVTVAGEGNVQSGVFHASEGFMMLSSGENGVYQSYPDNVAIIIRQSDGVVKTYTKNDVDTAISYLTGTILPGGTVTLYQSITTDKSLEIKDNWTLDLNGCTYTYTGSGDDKSAIKVRGSDTELKITDSSGKGGTVMVTGTPHSTLAAVSNSPRVHLTIDKGVTIKGAVFLSGKDQVLDIHGTVDSTGTKNYQGGEPFAVSGTNGVTENSTINIYEGALVQSSADTVAIYHPQSGTLNIYGGKVTGGTAIYMRAGELNLTGGEISGIGSKGDLSAAGGADPTGDAIVLEGTQSYTTLSASVSGGQVTSANADAVNVPEKATQPMKSNSFITGGRFSSDVKEYIADKHDQLVTTAATTPYVVGQYSDSGAASTMNSTVYKVTYTQDGKTVDVYYMSEDAAKEAAGAASGNATTPVLVPKPASTSSGDSSDSRANTNFWEDVEEEIRGAASGEIVKVDARSYDRMPWSVMEALRNADGVTLHITWNGGEDIVIPSAGAPARDSGRIYYPLSYLEGMDFTVKEGAAATDPGKFNPETGGILVVDAPAIADTIAPEATAPQRGLAQTPELADEGIEQAIPGIYEPEAAVVQTSTGNSLLPAVVLAAAALAIGGFGIFFWKRRRDHK